MLLLSQFYKTAEEISPERLRLVLKATQLISRTSLRSIWSTWWVFSPPHNLSQGPSLCYSSEWDLCSVWQICTVGWPCRSRGWGIGWQTQQARSCPQAAGGWGKLASLSLCPVAASQLNPCTTGDLGCGTVGACSLPQTNRLQRCWITHTSVCKQARFGGVLFPSIMKLLNTVPILRTQYHLTLYHEFH